MIKNSKTKATYMVMSSVIITILTFISIVAVITVAATRNDSIKFWNDAGMQTSLWIAVTLSTIFLIFSFVNGLVIMNKNWENSHLNSIKVMWGFLTIIPLFLVGSAIFGFIARKELRNYVVSKKSTRIVKEVVYECDDEDLCCCSSHH